MDQNELDTQRALGRIETKLDALSDRLDLRVLAADKLETRVSKLEYRVNRAAGAAAVLGGAVAIFGKYLVSLVWTSHGG